MKKVRVYELAKTKKISVAETIKLLKKAGLKKVTGLTSVDPSVLKKTSSTKAGTTIDMKLESAKVSHIFSAPSRTGSLAVKNMPDTKHKDVLQPETEKVKDKMVQPPKKENNPDQKKEQKQVQKEVAQSGKKISDKASKEKVKKKAQLVPAEAITAIAAVLALFLIGMLYLGQQADRALVQNLTGSVATIQETISKLGKNITTAQSNIKKINTDVSGLTTKMNKVGMNNLSSQLKSQSTILRVLSRNVAEPHKTKLLNLAGNLSAF